jgi:hypothetical protein
MGNVAMAIRTAVRFPQNVKFGVDDVDGSEDVECAGKCVGLGFVQWSSQVRRTS